MITRNIQELVYHLRPENEARPILLLGAGASFKAGVPLAHEMVNRIARFALAKESGTTPEHATWIMESDVLRFLSKHTWFRDNVSRAELYPDAVEHLLVPRDIRRRFFNSVMQQIGAPSGGHQALADLVQRQLVSTVLTTNFDGLIERALTDRSPHIRSVVTINKSPGDMVAFKPLNHAQVVYLHGSFDTYCDKNTIEETKELDRGLVQRLRVLTSYSPIIVMGYRGCEQSVMEHLFMGGLEDSLKYNHGIFWCARRPDEVHQRVHALADAIGSNFSLVKIDGFDEAMEFLNTELSGVAAYQIRSSSAFETPPIIEGDSLIENTLTLDDLEMDQLIAFSTNYTINILKTEFKASELEKFLVSYGFARREGPEATLRPTRGLYMLTGKDVTDRNPHLCSLLIKDGKHQIAFKGNLLKQFVDLRETLLGPEFNPTVRIKRPDGAVEMKAYHERAIVELLVNLMAHRNYSLAESSVIESDSQRSLTFKAPGGLPERVFRQLKPDETKGGQFQPKKNVREVRNPIIAEAFFSQGYMDKAGTGMADVVNFMQEHYGSSLFTVGHQNCSVSASLLRPAASGDSVGNTANPLMDREVYQTNLLPFVALPSVLFSLPLDPSYAAKDAPPWFERGVEDPARELVFVKHSGSLVSFGDFRNYESFCKRVGYLEHVTPKNLSEVIVDADERRVVVHLLHKHFERFLWGKAETGFFVEGREKRAYFVSKGSEGNSITYDSTHRRGVTRAVVKKRESPRRIEHENEGIVYSVVQHGDRWSMQIKPFYVFTGEDGKTPLPGHFQTSRATRRYKFDRNKAVEADMKFWSIFLSGGRPLINVGGITIPDLLLSASFLEAEALPL